MVLVLLVALGCVLVAVVLLVLSGNLSAPRAPSALAELPRIWARGEMAKSDPDSHRNAEQVFRSAWPPLPPPPKLPPMPVTTPSVMAQTPPVKTQASPMEVAIGVKVLAALEKIAASQEKLLAAQEEQRLDSRLYRAVLGQMLTTLDKSGIKETQMAKTLADFVVDLQTRMTTLTADVAKGTTVTASVVTLLQGLLAQNAALKAQIQQLIDAGGDPAVLAQLQTVVDTFDAQEQVLSGKLGELADAVVASTPSA